MKKKKKFSNKSYNKLKKQAKDNPKQLSLLIAAVSLSLVSGVALAGQVLKLLSIMLSPVIATFVIYEAASVVSRLKNKKVEKDNANSEQGRKLIESIKYNDPKIDVSYNMNVYKNADGTIYVESDKSKNDSNNKDKVNNKIINFEEINKAYNLKNKEIEQQVNKSVVNGISNSSGQAAKTVILRREIKDDLGNVDYINNQISVLPTYEGPDIIDIQRDR